MSEAAELIGREEEVAVVLGHLAPGSDDTGGSSVVLAGAAGVGKSRVARTVADRLEADGRIVHRHVATHAAASIPFGALLDLVPPGAGAAGPGDNRLEVLRRILTRLSSEARPAGQPLVMVDDAHLLDDASAALLHEIALRGGASLLVTIRSGEPSASAITSMWKDGRATRLDLRALSRTETAALVIAMLGGPVDERAIERVWQITLGNALFIREVVLNGQRGGTLREHQGLWTWHGGLRPDDRLVDAIRTAIGHAEGAVRDLVLVLAVAEELPLDLIDHLPEGDLLEEAERAGLVRVDPVTRRVSLAHPIYGETLRAELPEQEQRRVRTRLAAAIREAGDRPESVVWASWLLDAGDEVDPALLRQGAGHAMALLDYDLAARLGKAAFDASVESEDRLRAALWLALALNGQARFEEVDALISELQHEPGPEDVRGKLALEQSRARLWGLDDVDSGIAMLRGWEAELHEGVWHDVVVAELAHALRTSGQRDEAAKLALPLLEDGNDDRVRLKAFGAIAMDLAQQGQLRRVQELAAELLPVSMTLRGEILGAPFMVIVEQMLCHAIDGNLDAIDNIVKLATAAYTGGDDEARALLLAAAGGNSLLRGRVRTSHEQLRQALGLLESSGRTTRQHPVLVLLIETAALCGESELATALLAHARAVARRTEADQAPALRRAAVWETVAREGAARGRIDAVEAADFAAAEGTQWVEATCLFDALRLGAGRDVARRLAKVAGAMQGRIPVHAAAFGSAMAEGDADGVLAVSGELAALGFDLQAAETARIGARLHRRAGNHPAATRAVELSARLAAGCEGARSPMLVDDDEPGQALTPREREIVQLAAAGHSNRDIADQLVLSVRTVEGHLARAYPKLGIERREDLATVFGPLTLK